MLWECGGGVWFGGRHGLEVRGGEKVGERGVLWSLV